MGTFTFTPATIPYKKVEYGDTGRITVHDSRTSAVTIENIQNVVGWPNVKAGFAISTPTLGISGEDIREFRIFQVSTTFTPYNVVVEAAALPGYADAELWCNLQVTALTSTTSGFTVAGVTNHRVEYMWWTAPAFTGGGGYYAAWPQSVSSLIILPHPTADTKVKFAVSAFMESQVAVGGWATATATVRATQLLPEFTIRSISASSPEGESILLMQH